MKTTFAILAATVTLGACQTLKLAGLQPAPADECEFIADYMRDAHEIGDPLAVDPFAPRPGHTAVILEPVASSAKGVDPPRWYAAAPAPETQADLNSKVASVRLDTCPGLQRQLHGYGWSFRPPPQAKTGWFWGFTRIGFNAAHTEAVTYIVDGWAAGTGDAGEWAWFKKDPATGRWKSAGQGLMWIS